jgi:cobalt-zinc-cadmium efflux system protein
MAHPHHHHSPGHSHSPANYNKAFAIGVALNTAYIVLEAVFGVLVNSLALLADAGHNLSDVLGLLLAWGAHYLTRIRPTDRRTYGWRSTSILAALLNSLILLLAVGGIAWEAIQRLGQPREITATTVMWVAGVGVVVNAATAMLFFGGRRGDLNIKGAYLHMAADAGISLGVVLAGLGIWLSGWHWIDPLTSLVVAAIILIGTWELFRESIDLILQAVPRNIDLLEVRTCLGNLPGVEHVHDLHIWAMSTTEIALTAHLVKPQAGNDDQLLAEACQQLHDRFGIEHATLQVERDSEAACCRQVPPDAL